MNSSAKPALFLLPVYVGSLKYYEKLLPHLQSKYEPTFLIIRPDDDRRRGMLSYCRDRSLPFLVVDPGGESDFRVPFVSAVVKRIAHQKACKAIFKNAPKAKLVAVKAIAGFEPIFKEANRQGLETIVIQSALIPPPNFYRKDAGDTMPVFFYRVYHFFLSLVFAVSDLLTQGWSYIAASTHPRKVGVIGPEGIRIFKERYGFDPKTMTVVGTAEYERVSELKMRVREDEEFRDGLIRKYGLDHNKKRILILSVWFAHHGAVRPAQYYSTKEKERQITHYRRLIASVRAVCPAESYEVLFKLHPSEQNIYTSYETLDVRIFGDESISEELLVLSDLYIADPCTSANYMVVASGVPAIFDNTETLPALNKCALFYPITKIVQNIGEFQEAVDAFAKGGLSRGYDDTDIDCKSIERIARFIAS